MSKILHFDDLAELAAQERAVGKKIVLCHGVFDLLHIGHIRYLGQAKGLADTLIVTLTPDIYVDKGPGRPAFTEQLRAEALAALDAVDYVAINKWPTAENTLRALRPDFYAKGAEFKNLLDQTGKIQREAEIAREVGTELVFIDDIVFSSSNLINKYYNQYPEELSQYLALLRQRYQLDDVLSVIDRMKSLKVLVVGDAIIDQYAYTSALGISSKDPTLAMQHVSEESFAGGAMAVARHAAGLSDQVTLFTAFGENCPWLDMARQNLPSGLNLLYEEVPGIPTVRKLRYLENYSLTKLLEIYHISPDPLPMAAVRNMAARLEAIIGEYDVVLAADFGHGMIDDALVDILAKARFLAVNTQSNAGNRGYHTIWRYPRADFISLATHEVHVAFQNRRSPIAELMLSLYERMRPKTLLVTCGSKGVNIMPAVDRMIKAPALATRTVIDRVGAGDALFAATALAARLECPPEIMGLIGNIAGAALVESVGNNKSIDAGLLKKTITAMLK